MTAITRRVLRTAGRDSRFIDARDAAKKAESDLKSARAALSAAISAGDKSEISRTATEVARASAVCGAAKARQQEVFLIIASEVERDVAGTPSTC